MEKSFLSLKLGFAAVFSFLGTLLGGWDSPIYLLLCLMLLDFLTGIIKACRTKSVSSSKMKYGIENKILILFLIAIGVLIDKVLFSVFGQLRFGNFDIFIRNLLIFWFVIEEGISICENCAVLGIPLPKFVQEILACVESGANNSTPQTIISFIKKFINNNTNLNIPDSLFSSTSENKTKEEQSENNNSSKDSNS